MTDDDCKQVRQTGWERPLLSQVNFYFQLDDYPNINDHKIYIRDGCVRLNMFSLRTPDTNRLYDIGLKYAELAIEETHCRFTWNNELAESVSSNVYQEQLITKNKKVIETGFSGEGSNVSSFIISFLKHTLKIVGKSNWNNKNNREIQIKHRPKRYCVEPKGSICALGDKEHGDLHNANQGILDSEYMQKDWGFVELQAGYNICKLSFCMQAPANKLVITPRERHPLKDGYPGAQKRWTKQGFQALQEKVVSWKAGDAIKKDFPEAYDAERDYFIFMYREVNIDLSRSNSASQGDPSLNKIKEIEEFRPKKRSRRALTSSPRKKTGSGKSKQDKI